MVQLWGQFEVKEDEPHFKTLKSVPGVKFF